jgi:outer membrane protein
MSGNFKRITALVVGTGLLFAALSVQAQHQSRPWVGILSSPLIDPLNTRPPVLQTGKTLPGDTRPYAELMNCPMQGEAVAKTLQKPLALIDAVNIALCRNPQVQSAWASIKVQAAAVGEAGAAHLPTLTVGKTRVKDSTTYPESIFDVNSEKLGTTQFTSFAWRMFDSGARTAHEQSAVWLLEAALASHDAALQRVLSTVIAAYFDAQTARAAQLAKERSEALALQTLLTAQRREERGATALTDSLQATTALAKAALEKSRAQGAAGKANAVLAYALGISQSASAQGIQLAADVVDSEDTIRQALSHWLEQARLHHPSIMAAKAQLEAAKHKLAATLSDGLPTLDLAVNHYANGRPNQGLSGVQSKERMLMVTLSIPLFDGFARTYKVRGAEAQIEVKEAEFVDTQNNILSEVVKAYADAQAAVNNLAASQKLMSAAHLALESVQRKYEKGATDILELLATQVALSDAQQERIRALAEWRSARLRLLANTGNLGHMGIR